MIRLKFRNFLVWFFKNRGISPVRIQISRALKIIWPHIPDNAINFIKQNVGGETHWYKTLQTIQINHASGDLFIGRKRVSNGAFIENLIPNDHADLISHLNRRIIRREPSLILYSGQDSTASAFIAGVMCRFFSLDDAKLPKQILLLVNLKMGSTRLFQDSLTDQFFQPRAIELLRPRCVVEVEELHKVEGPLLTPAQLAKVRHRIDQIYGPFTAHNHAVVLCQNAAQNASRLIDKCDQRIRTELGSNYIALDAYNTPLRILISTLASARLVIVPEDDELSLLALLKLTSEIIVVQTGRPLSALAKKIQDIAGLGPISTEN